MKPRAFLSTHLFLKCPPAAAVGLDVASVIQTPPDIYTSNVLAQLRFNGHAIMNISQPVSSSVDRVEFTFLTKQEIHAISVKKIENDSTFDTLLNPVRGGLYDPALGSWGDTMCARTFLVIFSLLRTCVDPSNAVNHS